MADTPRAAVPVDIGLRPGMTVEVLTMGNSPIFVARVEQFDGSAVTLRDAKEDGLPRVMYNRELKLRYPMGEDTMLVHGKICGSTSEIWKLDRLESKLFKEQRAYFRQDISACVLAKCFRRSSRNVVAKEGYFCRVLDVSASGLMFSSSEIYEVGGRLTLTGACLTDQTNPFNFNCIVRRAVRLEHGVVGYGCQFEAMPTKEQDRLLRAIFIVQREEIRNQKEKEQL